MSTLLENITTLSSTVKDLKDFLVNKGLIDSTASLTQFKTEISATNISIQDVQIPLGAVKNIRFSIIDGILNICWEDPDNIIIDEMVVARFGSTKLMAKLDSYPTNHNDGTQLYSGTLQNAHMLTPLAIDLDALGLISEGHTIYFRFFSSTASTEYWNDDAQIGDANKFTSENYDWTKVHDALKNFPNLSSILPPAGSQISVNYIVNDYYLNGSTKVACETRQSVVDNADKLSTVSIPFHILGYNANVPQYVPYKKTDPNTGTTDYVYVQSVDDSVSAIDTYDSTGDFASKLTVDVGNFQFRNITAGNRVYVEDPWNLETSKKSYTYTNKNVQAVSESTFPYDNEGTGKQYIYNAPMAISVDGEKYDFCGYTMTLQPVYCLIGVTAATTNPNTTIQFDATENTYATPFETFPSQYDPSLKHYTLQADGLHEIDWSTSASYNINEYPEDVYCVEDNKIALKTAYYERYHKYNRLVTDGTTNTYQKLVEIFDFTPGETYYPDCEPKNYDATYNMSVYGDIVRYNGTLYLCKAQVTVSDSTPDQLTAYFRTLSSAAELSVQAMYDAGDYFVSGTKIPTTNGDGIVVEVCIINRGNGCNIYEESFYKQYCNNINGSRASTDSPYKKMNKFDNVSTTGLANSNSLMLKLYKQPDMIRHICKAANRTVLSLKNYQYRKNWQFIGSGTAYNTGRWETSLDLFWPLAYYEVFGSGADASSTFSIVYPNNTSRIKYNMTAAGGQGSAAYWWLRNPNTGNTYYESTVITSGQPNNYPHAHNSYGFSPAFIIC